MSIHMPVSPSPEQALPDHIAIGLSDETTRTIDNYVATTNDRLDEAVTDRTEHIEGIKDMEAFAAELVLDAVAGTLIDVMDDPKIVDGEEIKRDFRRLQIIAEQQRKRRFARPILHFDAIQYPQQRY